jgi:Xaa-Pro dipeptidase
MNFITPLSELESRWQRCQNLLREHIPSSGGLLVFSRLNIYYLTGTFGNGILWLPLEGKPLFLCRRGQERALLEAPFVEIIPFRSYREINDLLASAGTPLSPVVAAEMNGLTWSLGNNLIKYLPEVTMLPGDRVTALARSIKSSWELEKIRSAGQRHNTCLVELLGHRLKKNMTEWEISLLIWELFWANGHQGILRMENYGEEIFLGHIGIADNANYPSVFNGAVGLRGIHPALPHMGSNEVRWQPGSLLTCDVGFMFEGYHTDKTQVYWLGEHSSIPAEAVAAHAFCIECQQWIAENLKPGVLPSKIWEHCRQWAEQAGWSSGFMALAGNKVHFVGHGIGLAIDEYPAITKGFDLPLEEGMVLAIEPKIGIPGLGMVGVENTFEVTMRGGVSLTGNDYGIICCPE